MTKQLQQIAVSPADETIIVGPLSVRFLVTGDDSNGSSAIFELLVPATIGLPAPPHSHDRYEETIYGIEGSLTWTVDGTEYVVGPGQALCIPRGSVHKFENAGSVDAKALCIITPGVLGPAYFREVSEELTAAAGGPPNRERMAEIMLRHGLTPVAPTL